jgi:hypothetical protein
VSWHEKGTQGIAPVLHQLQRRGAWDGGEVEQHVREQFGDCGKHALAGYRVRLAGYSEAQARVRGRPGQTASG